MREGELGDPVCPLFIPRAKITVSQSGNGEGTGGEACLGFILTANDHILVEEAVIWVPVCVHSGRGKQVGRMKPAAKPRGCLIGVDNYSATIASI